MAKVRGPLMSLSASGTYRGHLEFRSGAEETVVAGPRVLKPTRTPAQQSQAQRFGQAIAGWRDLTPTAKADWLAAAQGTGLTGYQLYLRQYQLQHINPPGQPTLP